MSYWTTRRKIHEYKELLEVAWQCVNAQREMRVTAENPTALRQEVRTALKSADLYRGELEGRYVGLDGRTKLSIDNGRGELVFSPRGAKAIDLTSDRWSELEAAAYIRQYKGDYTTISYWPNQPVELFVQVLQQMGWNVEKVSERENGRVDLMVERRQQEGLPRQLPERIPLFERVQETPEDQQRRINEELEKLSKEFGS